jgi:hypothetical protein
MKTLQQTPMWLRWVLAILVFASAGTTLVIVLNNTPSDEGSGGSPAAEGRANQVGRIVVEQDQAPHTAPLARANSPRDALTHAIRADALTRIHHNDLSGPLQAISCSAPRPLPGSVQGYHCSVRSGNITYPFLGIVDLRTRRITWCKRDPPPVDDPELEVPINRACTS